MLGATQHVARRVAGIAYDRLPAEVVKISKQAILDTVGVILAGVAEPVTRAVAAMLAEDGSAPVSAQLGTRFRTSMSAAALLNGTSGHALDYDDVNISCNGHPSVVIVPAALAVAEAVNASGKDLITAYAVGVEVMGKLGLAMGLKHYAHGWHATATLGTLGAAMAAGKVLGLSEQQLARALAIAVSMASGSRRNFGTDTKPFHPGHAARCGVEAARLAGKDMTADITILEAQYGYFHLFSQGAANLDPLASLGEVWDLQTAGINVKKYPCCFNTHRAADAALDLAGQVDAGAIKAVEVRVPAGGLLPLLHSRPTTGLEGKFSMEYVVAAALLDQKLNLRTFTDPMVQRPDVRALVERVTVGEDPLIPVPHSPVDDGYVEVRLRLNDGREMFRRVERPIGSPDVPISQEQLVDKYRDCAITVLDAERVERSIHLLLALEQVASVRELVAVVTPRGESHA